MDNFDDFDFIDDVKLCPRCRGEEMLPSSIVCGTCRRELIEDGDGNWYAAWQREQRERAEAARKALG